MSENDPLLAEIRDLIQRVTGSQRTPPRAGRDTQLGDGLWLDSVELLEVVVACEEHFGILFDDAGGLESGVLDTLGTLTDLVRSKRAALPKP